MKRLPILPDHLTPPPPGYAYVGKGGHKLEEINLRYHFTTHNAYDSEDLLKSDGLNWTRGLGRNKNFHYAVRIDSPLGRHLLQLHEPAKVASRHSEKIGQWWDAVSHLDPWRSIYQGVKWNDLGPVAQDHLRPIFQLAKEL